jgi:undecaprenyl-diphosphatase
MTLAQNARGEWSSRRTGSTRKAPGGETRGPVTVAPPDWSGRRIAVGIGLWVVGAVVLAALSVAARSSPEFAGDVGLAEAIQRLNNPAIKSFINFASDASWPTPAGIITIAVILALALLRHLRAAVCAAVSGFGADALNVTLNGLVARPRPNNVHIHAVAHLGLHSYPSGHVTHVIAFYGFLFYLSRRAWRRLGDPAAVREIGQSRNWLNRVQAHASWKIMLIVVQVICGYFIVFIGPSRVLEGEHWPSDVVASYLLGALVLLVGIGLYHTLGVWWHGMQERRASGLQGGIPARA